jgi:hypothetical protein
MQTLRLTPTTYCKLERHSTVWIVRTVYQREGKKWDLQQWEAFRREENCLLATTQKKSKSTTTTFRRTGGLHGSRRGGRHEVLDEEGRKAGTEGTRSSHRSRARRQPCLHPWSRVPPCCKEPDARSLRGGGGELGNLKVLTYGFTIFAQR